MPRDDHEARPVDTGMTGQPTLQTARLMLRPWDMADAPGLQGLAGRREIADTMVRNPASGRALEKTGMKREGLLRQCVRKWGRFEDVVVMAILREDWAQQAKC